MLDAFRGDPRFVHSRSARSPPPSTARSSSRSSAAPRSRTTSPTRLREADRGQPVLHQGARPLARRVGRHREGRHGRVELLRRRRRSRPTRCPATIQQAVEKRIERLPEELRELLSVASVLGKTFDVARPRDAGRGRGDLDDAIDRLVREGMLEEERESRGDRLTFSSGIVRDVLYAALSPPQAPLAPPQVRGAPRGAPRRPARARLPELVHHYSQGDVPEKTVEYGLKLAQKSLDAFSPEDAVRVAKIALEFLEDEEWAGDRALEGEARLLLAQGQRMAGNIDGALREAEAAVRVFEEQKQPGPGGGRAAVRGGDRLAGAADRRGAAGGSSAASRRRGPRATPRACAQLLSLAATLANLRGEYAKAAAYQAEIERLAPERRRPRPRKIPRGGTLVVALANPVARDRAGALRDERGAGGPRQRLRDARRDRRAGQPGAGAVRAVEALEGGRALPAAPAPRRRLLRRRAADGARAVKASLERSIRSRDARCPRPSPRSAASRSIVDGRAGRRRRASRSRGTGDRDPAQRAASDLPALLTDPRTAIVAAGAAGGRTRPLGTGPFRVALHTPERVVLERNPGYWKEPAPRLETGSSSGPRSRPPRSPTACGPASSTWRATCSPRTSRRSSASRASARARRDAEEEHLLRALQRRQRRRCSNAAAAARARRRRPDAGPRLGDARPLRPARRGPDPARASSATTRDGGSRTCPARRRRESARGGRLAPDPAPGRRPPDPPGPVRRADAGALPRSGRSSASRSRSRRRHARVPRARWTKNEGIDLMLGRWIADYDDPDNFTFTLFHSGNGPLRELLLLGREPTGSWRRPAPRAGPAAREALYRKFEQPAARLGGPRAALPRRGLPHRGPPRAGPPAAQHRALRELRRARKGRSRRAGPRSPPPAGGGIVHVPDRRASSASLDPAARLPPSRARSCRASSRR